MACGEVDRAIAPRRNTSPTAKSDHNDDAVKPSEVSLVHIAVDVASEPYGHTPVAEFGPLALKAVRQAMIGKGWARTTINQHVARLVRMFRWGVENELVSPTILQALKAVPGLRAGRTSARKPEPVRPVPDDVVEKTLAHLPLPVAAMVRLQRLTGMRPSEV